MKNLGKFELEISAELKKSTAPGLANLLIKRLQTFLGILKRFGQPRLKLSDFSIIIEELKEFSSLLQDDCSSLPEVDDWKSSRLTKNFWLDYGQQLEIGSCSKKELLSEASFESCLEALCTLMECGLPRLLASRSPAEHQKSLKRSYHEFLKALDIFIVNLEKHQSSKVKNVMSA